VKIIWTRPGTEDFLVRHKAEGVIAVGSYPQPRRSPVLEKRRCGAMDNFQGSISIDLFAHDLDPDG
jgi:hypothetical protein